MKYRVMTHRDFYFLDYQMYKDTVYEVTLSNICFLEKKYGILNDLMIDIIPENRKKELKETEEEK